ncbi:MAG: hypothetical protein RR906_05155, partial [Acetivibrio sp.]
AGCKPKKNGKDYLIQIGMIAGVIVCVGLFLFSGSILLGLLGTAGIVAVVLLYPKLNYEYEYVFCDGQIDFDKIQGGNRRKTVLKVDMDDMELCGPVKASELASYKNLKVKDFSSRKEDAATYAAIVSIKGENVRILFDPTQKMLEAMRMKSPRKVLKNW